MSLVEDIRDRALYSYGYFTGRSYSLTDYTSKFYGLAISKVSSLISLPLPLLSFLALPFFGGTSSTINLAFFYLTWTALVWSYDPLRVELYGTLAIRLVFYLLPAYAFLAIDTLVPSLATSTKAAGNDQLPSKLPRQKLAAVALVATLNTLLPIALQAAIEWLLTDFFHTRSALRVSSAVPLPWSMAKDILRALALRGMAHYAIHRYILHAPPRTPFPLSRWHRTWAHSIRYPFSLTATYDHPLCHIVAHWLPIYLPAVLFRFHVLTWHLLLVLTSLEQLFLYSGYAILPSRILLAGMARRTDAHYATKGAGNFGHWGVMDWACGTGANVGEADIEDDLRGEAQKHDVQGKVADAKDNARGLAGDAKERFGGGGGGSRSASGSSDDARDGREESTAQDYDRAKNGSKTDDAEAAKTEDAEAAKTEDVEGDEDRRPSSPEQGKRRTRRKTRKT